MDKPSDLLRWDGFETVPDDVLAEMRGDIDACGPNHKTVWWIIDDLCQTRQQYAAQCARIAELGGAYKKERRYHCEAVAANGKLGRSFNALRDAVEQRAVILDKQGKYTEAIYLRELLIKNGNGPIEVFQEES